MPLRDGFFSTATQTSCCNRIQRSNRVRLLVVSTHDFPDINCCESTGTGLVVPKVVFVTGADLAGPTMDQLMCASLFPTPPFGGYVESIDRPTVSKAVLL